MLMFIAMIGEAQINFYCIFRDDTVVETLCIKNETVFILIEHVNQLLLHVAGTVIHQPLTIIIIFRVFKCGHMRVCAHWQYEPL